MPQIPRYLEKWESADGVTSYTFPRQRYEYDSRQQFSNTRLRVAGADYSWDASGHNQSIKEDGVEAIRFLLNGATAAELDSAADEIRSKIQLGAQGKLWVKDGAGVRRWAYARATEMPAISLRVGDKVTAPTAIGFARISDWYGTTAVAGTATVNTIGTTVVNIVNSGNIPSKRGTLRFRSNDAAGWANPMTLLNVNNGYQFTYARAGTLADAEMRIDIHKYQVRYSESNGATYESDYVNLTLGQAQVGFMQWEPGTNIVRIIHNGGTPNFNLEWSFDPPFA